MVDSFRRVAWDAAITYRFRLSVELVEVFRFPARTRAWIPVGVRNAGGDRQRGYSNAQDPLVKEVFRSDGPPDPCRSIVSRRSPASMAEEADRKKQTDVPGQPFGPGAPSSASLRLKQDGVAGERRAGFLPCPQQRTRVRSCRKRGRKRLRR